MSRARSPLAFFLTCVAGLLILHACQETPEITEPRAAAVVTRRLTVSGIGSGSGKVTSSPAGINCTITLGQAAGTGCTALFTQGVTVTLTAPPASGHSFIAWSGSCSGKGTCRVSMTVARAVTARFLKGPFRIRISGGSTGAGNGTVSSQVGLTPAINCAITNGVAAATGCSATYPAYTSLVLTATPAAGNAFTGWGAPCSGNGTCTITVIQPRTIAARFAGGSQAAESGEWTAPFSWPVVAIHMNLLPTGEVLTFGRLGAPQIWNPASGSFTSFPSPSLLFCSGHTFLPDGRLLVSGGHIGAHLGLPHTNVFDPLTRTWTRLASMAQGRWYPTTTTLANGEIVTVAGTDEDGEQVPVPEVWNGSAWRRLTGASLTLPYYPWLFQAPNGKIFYAGPTRGAMYLDPSGTGAWTPVANSDWLKREQGTAVMYEPGKVMIVGGWEVEGTVASRTAEIIDLNSAAPSWQNTGSMAIARRHHDATLLPTGEVLVTGGTSGPGWNNVAGAVHQAEVWNPATGTWKTLAANQINRLYHTTAILLPDGRVLVAGSGAGGGGPDAMNELNAEIYSPPYLFRGQRPTLTDAPAATGYGTSFSISTPDAASIAKVTLIRLGSVTHGFDQSQVFIGLDFQPASGGVTATAPATGNLAPPGYYQLFLVNADGIPSRGRAIRLH